MMWISIFFLIFLFLLYVVCKVFFEGGVITPSLCSSYFHYAFSVLLGLRLFSTQNIFFPYSHFTASSFPPSSSFSYFSSLKKSLNLS